ncbi:hypothetical protein SLA2020_448940 [Shorea laevis]
MLGSGPEKPLFSKKRPVKWVRLLIENGIGPVKLLDERSRRAKRVAWVKLVGTHRRTRCFGGRGCGGRSDWRNRRDLAGEAVGAEAQNSEPTQPADRVRRNRPTRPTPGSRSEYTKERLASHMTPNQSHADWDEFHCTRFACGV